jgi:hypothetical protein
MSKRPRKAIRAADAGYPTLDEHLTSRRQVLVSLGTAAAAAAIGWRCGPGGVVLPPDYYTTTFRIPEQGELTVELNSGGAIQFSIRFVAHSEGAVEEVRSRSSEIEAACVERVSEMSLAEICRGNNLVGETVTEVIRGFATDTSRATIEFSGESRTVRIPEAGSLQVGLSPSGSCEFHLTWRLESSCCYYELLEQIPEIEAASEQLVSQLGYDLLSQDADLAQDYLESTLAPLLGSCPGIDAGGEVSLYIVSLQE